MKKILSAVFLSVIFLLFGVSAHADNSVFYGTFTLDGNEVFEIGNDESKKCNDDDDEYEYLYVPLEGSTATYQCGDNTIELTITDYTITIAEEDDESTDDWSVIFSTDYNSLTYSGTTVDAGGVDNFSGTGVRAGGGGGGGGGCFISTFLK